jgi:hypothetical protein
MLAWPIGIVRRFRLQGKIAFHVGNGLSDQAFDRND